MKAHHHPWKESPNEKVHFIHEQHHMNSRHQNLDDQNLTRHSAKLMRFYCAAPHANLVELVGDFNHWHPFPMSRSEYGWWVAQVELSSGHHKYRFLVDGRPMLDPYAIGIVRDDNNEDVSLVAVI